MILEPVGYGQELRVLLSGMSWCSPHPATAASSETWFLYMRGLISHVRTLMNYRIWYRPYCVPFHMKIE